MGTVIKRGTRSAPRFYGQVKLADGRRTNLALKGVRSKPEAMRVLAEMERRIQDGQPPFPEVPAGRIRVLMERWRDSLTNRNAANDVSRINRHLIPRFGHMLVEAAARLPVVMDWIDDLKRTDLAPASQRLLVNLLSRFWSWAIEREAATVNPVRSVPVGRRPLDTQKRDDVPWLRDEGRVSALMETLPRPVDLMFYLANRSGLRLGEVCGLRMMDLDRLNEGLIVVGRSYGGPLKEDKGSVGKTKIVPAPVDAPFVLRAWQAERRLAGAAPIDLVFPFVPNKPQNRRRTSAWTGYRKEHVEALWSRAAKDCGVALTWYQATRHSFVSRALSEGASVDEVADAVGHSSPAVTLRSYAHFKRVAFSPALRRGLSQVAEPKP